jgi:hypothetical protein
MRETRSVFGNTDFWKKNEWALGLVMLITRFFAISIIPFTRKDCGERYLSWLNLYFGYSLLAAFIFVANILGSFVRLGSSQLMTLFLFAFIGMSLYRRWEITQKNKVGILWHSNYLGTSLLPLPFSPEKLFKIYEPATVFVVGYFFWQISGMVGLWLMVGGASLLINNHIIYYQERQTVLDLRDAQIEAQYFSDAVAGKPASETAGFVIAESSVQLIGRDASLTEAFSNLSDEMKSLLDAPTASTGDADAQAGTVNHVGR